MQIQIPHRNAPAVVPQGRMAIHRAMESGEDQISAALLAGFDANATFFRLPLEPIDRAACERPREAKMARRRHEGFFEGAGGPGPRQAARGGASRLRLRQGPASTGQQT